MVRQRNVVRTHCLLRIYFQSSLWRKIQRLIKLFLLLDFKCSERVFTDRFWIGQKSLAMSYELLFFTNHTFNYSFISNHSKSIIHTVYGPGYHISTIYIIDPKMLCIQNTKYPININKILMNIISYSLRWRDINKSVHNIGKRWTKIS